MSRRLFIRVPDALLALLLIAIAMIGGAAHAVENANVADPAAGPELRENQPFAATVTVRNPHDRAVRIERIDSTCTCTVLDMAERFILPKATAELKVQVDNRMRSGPQHVNVSLFMSDPDLETIEVSLDWKVRAIVQVDAIAPGAATVGRPAERAWHDVYKYLANQRPDELHRLRKRIRIASPAEETPPGGLRVTRIDYPGSLWRFAEKIQEDGSTLITASARDADAAVAEGVYDETVVVHTNHPDKPTIELSFSVTLSKQAGAVPVDVR